VTPLDSTLRASSPPIVSAFEGDWEDLERDSGAAVDSSARRCADLDALVMRGLAKEGRGMFDDTRAHPRARLTFHS
jgi:hypothetical protein